MELQGQDGELRLYSRGAGGTTYFLQVLFCEMDFTAPTSRPRTEENLQMNRNKFDTNAHYTLGPDNPRYEPIPISFSCRATDFMHFRSISDWLSGTSTPGSGATTLTSWKGHSAGIDGNVLPEFSSIGGDPQPMAYLTEILWDGSKDYGWRGQEVVFTPGETTVTESADGVVVSANGMIYGDVTRITAFAPEASTEF